MWGILRTLLIALCMSTAMGGEIVFVINKDVQVDKLPKKEIRKILLKKRKFLKGLKLIPLNLPPENGLRKLVEKKVLGMDREEVELYWNKSYLHGVEPPLVLNSEEAVKEFVKKVKGSIGYISSEKLDEDLKVIYRLKKE